MTAITRRPSVAGLSLWQVDLDAPLAHGACAMLSVEERSRANRFVLERNRRHFIAAHAALRQLLAIHTRGHPGNLLFGQGSFGKPWLVHPPGVHFNLSHSQTTALIAIGTVFPVGVDVELVRPLHDALTLAADYFTQAECDALKRLSGTPRDQAFLTCWTRKEACLKALGFGLQLPPQSFEVGVLADARLVVLPTPTGETRVSLTPVDTAIGSVGSLAQWVDSSSPARRVERHRESVA